MNDLKRTAVMTCDALTSTKTAFEAALLKATGTTLQGIKIDPEIKAIWKAKGKV